MLNPTVGAGLEPVMKIIVCIKQVPNVSELKFDNQKRTLIREGVHNEINPFDRRALTFASELKKKIGGEVVAMTMGPPQAREALIEALAMGADKALHLLDRAFAGSDTLATARALSMAINREKPFDLILCGKYSVDAETGHIGPEVAELLGIPNVSGATKVEFSDSSDRVIVEAETDYGFQSLETQLPLLITAAERLVKPHRPTAEDIEAARTKSLSTLSASELGEDMSVFGSNGSPTTVGEIYSIETKRECEIIEGSTSKEKVMRLVERILAEGLFTGWRNARTNGFRPPDYRMIIANKPIWVVAEFIQGHVRPVTYELLGRGTQLADELGSELCTIVLGEISADQVQDLIAHGSDKVYKIKSEQLAVYSSDTYAAALSDAIEKFKPFAVIAASTSLGRDFMPRVAASLGLGMTSDCIGLQLDGERRLVQLKPAFGGSIVAPILSRTCPQLATVRPGVLTAAEPNPVRKGSLVEVNVARHIPLSHVREERFESDRNALRLDDAQIVVAAGAGVGGPKNLHVISELSEILDAPVAATRKIVDLGWLPRQLQVGLTGRSIAPELYVAIGVRGAFNHMVGVGRAKRIVAINNDPNAPIFRNCDFGVVGDFADIIPMLNETLRTVKSESSTLSSTA
jgi:electron transfer flavoprotein alpha subunit